MGFCLSHRISYEASMSTSHVPQSERPHWALWIGVLAGPILWFVQMEANFVLVRETCGTGRLNLLRGITVASAIIAMLAAMLAWRNFRTSANAADNPGLRRFMGSLGILVSLLFALVILAQGLPTFFIDPCKE
jgi:hypothetical protein